MFVRVLSFVVFALFASFALAQSSVTNYSPDNFATNPSLDSFELVVDARLAPGSDTIESGMIWRVFGKNPQADEALSLVATAEGGTASFTLNKGVYFIHVSYGRAGASKQVAIENQGVLENLILNAGGLQLNATAENSDILAKDLRFSIFETDKGDDVERKVIAKDIPANQIIPLNAGTYQVLSHYGTINAEVRAELEVKPGEVTRATMQHRGAGVSLRLVSHPGGDPVANSAWSVFTQDGEKVFESDSIAPSLILAEGSYEAAARNGNRNYKKTFEVKPGSNIRVEILLQ